MLIFNLRYLVLILESFCFCSRKQMSRSSERHTNTKEFATKKTTAAVVEMDLVRLSRSLPPFHRTASQSSAASAASFLSEWLDRNSFCTEGSATEGSADTGSWFVVGSGAEDKVAREDLPRRTGRAVDGGDENNEEEDLGISIGQIVGGDDFVKKPFDVPALLDRMTEMLGIER